MGQSAKATRQNRTLTVDFHDESTYFQLLSDGKAFVDFVLAFLLALGFQLNHKTLCHGGGVLPPPPLPFYAGSPRRPHHLAHAVYLVQGCLYSVAPLRLALSPYASRTGAA